MKQGDHFDYRWRPAFWKEACDCVIRRLFNWFLDLQRSYFRVPVSVKAVCLGAKTACAYKQSITGCIYSLSDKEQWIVKKIKHGHRFSLLRQSSIFSHWEHLNRTFTSQHLFRYVRITRTERVKVNNGGVNDRVYMHSNNWLSRTEIESSVSWLCAVRLRSD